MAETNYRLYVAETRGFDGEGHFICAAVHNEHGTFEATHMKRGYAACEALTSALRRSLPETLPVGASIVVVVSGRLAGFMRKALRSAADDWHFPEWRTHWSRRNLQGERGLYCVGVPIIFAQPNDASERERLALAMGEAKEAVETTQVDCAIGESAERNGTDYGTEWVNHYVEP